MHAMVNIALRAARDAADTVVRAGDRLDRVKVFEKGSNDYVTEIDHAVEEALIADISRAYPHHSFLCEESGYLPGKDEDTVWIIDPIDGTRNFMRGLPHYCITIACRQNGRIRHAVTVDPVRRDEFTASRGEGAKLNGARIRVGSSDSLRTALVSLSCAGGRHYDEFIALQQKLQGNIAGLRFTGSAALDLAYVAAGRLDAGWMSGLKPWDVSAGILLIQEAGGLISDLTGNPDCEDSDSFVFGNARCFKQLLQSASELRKVSS